MSAPDLLESVHIAATPERVWALVSDVRRMCEWSPQVDSTRLRSGFDSVGVGTEFTNRNSDGDLVWTTHGEVVRFEPEGEIAFRIEENWVIWSLSITPEPAGVELVQRREAPEGISALSLELTNGFMGGVEAFTASMRAGMRLTLERIKAEAES